MNFKNKINLAVMAHVDAGKTTVTEEFLYHSGAKKVLGNVDKGTTTTDSLSLEKERGITIRSATVSFNWKEVKINLIDTPGHMDFIAEVERSFSVLDGAVLVISAKEGVQPQTRTIFQRLQKLKIPTIIFINKIDRMGVNLSEIRTQIEQELTKDVVYMQEIYEDKNYEQQITEHILTDEYVASQLILYSEKLYDIYFDQEQIEENIESFEKDLNTIRQDSMQLKENIEDTYHDEYYKVIQQGKVCPVYYGSALKNIGIESLMDGIVAWLQPQINPSCLAPLDGSITGTELLNRLQDELSAYVYKVEWICKNYRKAYIRVYHGALWFKQRVPIYGTESMLTMNMYCALENGKEGDEDYILPGDICVLYGSGPLKCGDWLGRPVQRKGLSKELNPLLMVQVRPHDPERRMELLDALNELEIEDPYLKVTKQENEITLRLFGKLQKDIIQDTLMERYHLQLDVDDVQTVKKEWPCKWVLTSIGMHEVFDEETKSLFYGQSFNKYAAGITISIEPLESGSGIEFINKVSFGDLEKPFQNGVKEGLMAGLEVGLGHEVIDTRITFLDMEYSSVMSTPADYRNLATMIVRKALHESGVRLIQPYMNYTARVPLGYEKYITAKLIEIRASIITSEFTASEAIFSGEVALDDVKDFALDIRMYTEGKGSFELEFLEYRE